MLVRLLLDQDTAVTRETARALAEAGTPTASRIVAQGLAAADDSLALVAAGRGAVPLRTVVSVDVPEGVVTPVATAPDAAESAVEVATVAGVEIVAVHVDEPEAAADVRAVLAAADGGDEQDDALDAALERVTDRDLLWYDPTEIPRIPRP